MSGPGENETGTHERAILALLSERTVAAAARTAKVSEATLWRWLQQPNFQTSYRAAPRQLVEAAIAGLQRISSEAVDALRRNLKATQAGVQVRAAQVIL